MIQLLTERPIVSIVLISGFLYLVFVTLLFISMRHKKKVPESKWISPEKFKKKLRAYNPGKDDNRTLEGKNETYFD